MWFPGFAGLLSNWRSEMRARYADLYRKEFLDCAMDAVSNSLSQGMTPDYLFVAPKLRVIIDEFCGMKIWVTPLPEDRKIIAVVVHSSKPKANNDE